MRFLNSLKITALFIVTSCTIYQSPERKSFESESPSFKVQSLQKISCGSNSIQDHAEQSRLITLQNEIALWEHVIQNQSIFESNELNKEYCLYENKK